MGPSQNEVNRYGSSITFRLTVTDPQGASASDNVTYRFEGPPTASISLTASLPAPGTSTSTNPLTQQDCEAAHTSFSVNAISASPGQSGNSANEYDVREGACLTLTGTGTLAAGSTGRLTYSWAKLSAVPNRSVYNVPTNQRSTNTLRILLPNDYEAGRGAIVHYTLTVTSSTGLQGTATIRVNVVDVPATPQVTLTLADSRQPVQDANAINPNAAAQSYVVQPGATVELVATASDTDAGQQRTLEHKWTGTAVVPSTSNRAGATTRATLTIPANATIGQNFAATVEVTDTTGRKATDQALFYVAINAAPTATVPGNFPTEDGPRGGTNRMGTIYVRGGGVDPDGDTLTYRWRQVNDSGVPLTTPTVQLNNSTSRTVSFAAPQLPANGQRQIHLELTVADRWGVGDSATVTVTVLGRNERPIANAGPDQTVEPGAFVRLNGTNSIDPDPGTALSWEWTYTGLATTPSQATKPLTSYQKNIALRGFVPDGTDYSSLRPLVSQYTPLPSFTAPELGGLSSVQLTFTLTLSDRAGGKDTDTVTVTVTGRFFSSYITGPDFCTNLSLGGPRTYAHDSNNDGVADVCSLPYTRREAVARQNALITLANLEPARFRTAALAACNQITGTFGEAQADLDKDICATRQVSEPPPPVDPAKAALFFSSYITGPEFCTNFSLGGPRTYAHDSNNDGVADVCSLPYTRREAVARQNALAAFTTPEAVYNSAVALACRQLGSAVFEGDSAAAMATDACA